MARPMCLAVRRKVAFRQCVPPRCTTVAVMGVLRWASVTAFSTAAASVLSGAASLPALLSKPLA